MLRTRRTLLIAGIVTGSIAIARPAPRDATASYAAPEIIIFHGDLLARPIVVASWAENHTLLLTAAPRAPARPSGARTPRDSPRIELALFWGIRWRDYAASPARLRSLSPAQATQRGVFYPAVPGAHAMIAVGSIRGSVSDSGLAVLRRHGIPTSVP
jgi:hypothetical protein